MQTRPLLLLFLTAFAPQDPEVRLFEEAWGIVRKNFYDPAFHGKDWDAVKKLYRPEAEKARTPREIHGVINRMLGELKASHCVLMEGDVYRDNIAPEFSGRPTVRPGLELAEFGGRHFVSAVYEGGPAERAGLRLGDRVVSVDGTPAERSPALVDAGTEPLPGAVPHSYVRVARDAKVSLEVERAEGGPKSVVEVAPEELSLVQATRDSVRVVERGGRKVGYIHLWHFLSSDVAKALRRAVAEDFAGCDALLVDLRGRGGSPLVLNQALAACRQWGRPAAALVDEGTRSAKEVFAHQWRKAGLGPLVGTRTAGAVLGSSVFKLSDGSYLLLAVQGVDGLTGGAKLEGKGVEPDVAVTRDLRWAAGRDAIFERGVNLLVEKTGGKVRREY